MLDVRESDIGADKMYMGTSCSTEIAAMLAMGVMERATVSTVVQAGIWR